MLFKFGRRIRHQVVDSGLAGDIPDHSDRMTKLAIERMITGDAYFDLGIKAIKKAAKLGLTPTEATELMAQALGISVKRFHQAGASYIDPELAIKQLRAMMDQIDAVISSKGRILLATGHPGSLLQFYLCLESYIVEHGGEDFLIRIDKSWKINDSMWIDAVESVAVVSDLGSLIHSHDHRPMEIILEHLKGRVDLVIADHGFAGAAINAEISTVGLHDVDDPAIPIAGRFGAKVLAVPMNDNQRNLRTEAALIAVIETR